MNNQKPNVAYNYRPKYLHNHVCLMWFIILSLCYNMLNNMFFVIFFYFFLIFFVVVCQLGGSHFICPWQAWTAGSMTSWPDLHLLLSMGAICLAKWPKTPQHTQRSLVLAFLKMLARHNPLSFCFNPLFSSFILCKSLHQCSNIEQRNTRNCLSSNNSLRND